MFECFEENLFSFVLVEKLKKEIKLKMSRAPVVVAISTPYSEYSEYSHNNNNNNSNLYPQVTEIEGNNNNNNYNNNNNNSIQVYATPLSNNNRDFSIPIYAEAVQPLPNNQQRSVYGNTIFMTSPQVTVVNTAQSNLNESLARIIALSRSLRCLTIVDLATLIILSIFQLYWIFFLWGPLAGYYGVTRHRLYFLYCYIIYWVIRVVIDVLLILNGDWWYIISLIIDTYILRYVRIYTLNLKSLTDDQLELLRQFQREHNELYRLNYFQNP